MKRKWPAIPLIGERVDLGFWRLPASEQAFSEARVALSLIQLPGGSGSQAEVQISYPNTQLGLFFTFSLVMIEYVVRGEPQVAFIDWSEGCTQLGVSLRPQGAPITKIIDLPGTAGARVVESFSFHLWGAPY